MRKANMESSAKLSRANDAYNRLKTEILENRMPPGFQGTEPEIALRLNMSRTPVREALLRLQGEGLVELKPRRGVRVLPIAPSDMREIYQLLTVLEPEAAADIAIAGVSPDEIAVLDDATTEMELALAQGDLDKWAAADDRFHRELLKLNENGRLSAFVNTLFDQAHRARMVTLRLRTLPHESTLEHRRILNAIAKGDADKTRALFRAHRERAATELLSVLEECRLTQL